MSEPDRFLARWSRRKRLAGEEQAAPESDAAHAGTAHADESTESTPDSKPAASQAPQAGATPKPDFDPASLPSLDSIGADTDIGPFLKAGVPAELRHAALRRAWSADPAIRDFKGLQENDWNFNDPNGIPGFGELSPTTDVKKMLGDLFGDSRREAETAAGQVVPAEPTAIQSPDLAGEAEDATQHSGNQSTPDLEISSAADVTTEQTGEMLRRNIDDASQDAEPNADGAPSKRRRGHGGALPQ